MQRMDAGKIGLFIAVAAIFFSIPLSVVANLLTPHLVCLPKTPPAVKTQSL
jgi:hypothetical protein